MITVRFPSGFSVQYNTASYVIRGASYSDLYTKKEGSWVAQIPLDAIIETIPACRSYFAATPNDAVALEKRALEHQVSLLQKQVARLKKAVKP